jgi:hypothetical protein
VEVPGNQSAVSSRNTSPEKGKGPKKKPRTLTDFVTAQYAPAQPPPRLDHPVSTFFNSHTKKLPLNDTHGDSAKGTSSKPMRRKLSSEKSTKGESKAKKPNPKSKSRTSKLLSPGSAVVQMNAQEVVFGTSSQLAREESPSLVRQIQQALRESEVEAELLSAMRPVVPEKPSPLWSAGARDLDNQLFKEEVSVYFPDDSVSVEIPIMTDYSIDIGKTPLQVPPAVSTRTVRMQSQPPDQYNDSSFTDIDHFTAPPSPAQTSRKSSFEDIDNYPAPQKPVVLSTSSDEPTFASVPTSSLHSKSPSQSTTPSAISSSAQPTINRPTSQPSICQNSPKVASNRLKKRPPLSATPITPNKASHPRRFANVDEIQDSEDDSSLSPTPPRISYPTSSQPLPLNLQPSQPPSVSRTRLHGPILASTTVPSHSVVIHKRPPTDLTWKTAKADIFSQISKIVRNLPPSSDPRNPTWHERILMYDPIILEDFTTWLNSQPGIKVWRKATVKQIREDKKIKRLAERERKAQEKERLKRKREERKALGLKAVRKKKNANETDAKSFRAGASGDKEELCDIDDFDIGGNESAEQDMVDAVQTELETWMVQRWCQEYSVCCVNREKMPWGGRKNVY